MTSKEFTEAGQEYQRKLTGKIWGWQSTLAFKIKMSVRTVNRYANGKAEIPERVSLTVQLLTEQK